MGRPQRRPATFPQPAHPVRRREPSPAAGGRAISRHQSRVRTSYPRSQLVEPVRALRRARSPAEGPVPQSGTAAVRRPAPPAKLRRNELCWCGSGKKYKRCHLQPGS
ncbi:SEC-C metal-binding domain-containing protein [Parafrankia colletiae]|uniref:SEC-C metal-binding domain-containing protein n=1 Tax=Parafrankia colletiae TaxID=573497 RepID=UPI003898E864